MKIKVGPSRPGAVHRTRFFSLRLATAILGVVAIGAIVQLFSGGVDICGGTSGWWIGAVFISPLVWVGLCAWCATVTTSDAERSVWVTVAGFLIMLYVFGASATLVRGGALATTWC